MFIPCLASPPDIPLILRLIRKLAEFESVVATGANLLCDGFGDKPAFRCLIAECDGSGVGFALFLQLQHLRGHTGIHLEDLYVTPAMRGKGIGRALIARVAAEDGCPRFQWDVLEWNASAIPSMKV